jgi:apolipoprotein D and lipocalin family protein
MKILRIKANNILQHMLTKWNMHMYISFALFALPASVSNAQEQSVAPLDVVSAVDLNKYAGVWYEIARLPNGFQKQCAGDVTATYTLLDDGRIKVVNRCRNEKGEIEEAEGEAKRSGDDAPTAKLKVRFAPAILSFLPFVWGDYWIIVLAPDYSYAVVGDPARKYLWILSRTPVLGESIFKIILDQVKAKGYDLTSLVRTNQSGK